MTQTNTDYLFQFTRTTTERNAPPPTSSDADDRFDDHLSQASAGNNDDSNSAGANPRGAASTIYHSRQARHDSNRVDNARGSARTHSNAKAKQRSANSTNDSKPTHSADDENNSTNEAETDDENKNNDESTSSDSPECATVEQIATVKNAAPATSSTTPADVVPVPAIMVAAENPAANADANSNSPPSNTEGAANSDIQAVAVLPDVSQAVADVKTSSAVTQTATANVDDTAAQTQVQQEALNQDPTNKSNDRPDTPNKKEPTAAVAQQFVNSASLVGQSETPVATQTASNPTAAVAPPTDSAKPKTAPGDDKTAKDDSRHDSQADATADQTTAPNQPNKAAVVPVANIAAATQTDVAVAKANDEKNESTVKPVTSKGDTTALSFTRLTRAGGGANGSETNTNGDVPPIDPARFVNRVAKAFQTASQRGGTLQIRLSPPDLGSLRLEMTVKDGVLTARLETENANARRLLLDHLPALRDRLSEQNIRVDRFDVDVRRDGTGAQPDTRGSQQQAFHREADQPAPRKSPTPQLQPRNVARAQPAPITPTINDTGLNLIV